MCCWCEMRSFVEGLAQGAQVGIMSINGRHSASFFFAVLFLSCMRIAFRSPFFNCNGLGHPTLPCGAMLSTTVAIVIVHSFPAVYNSWPLLLLHTRLACPSGNPTLSPLSLLSALAWCDALCCDVLPGTALCRSPPHGGLRHLRGDDPVHQLHGHHELHGLWSLGGMCVLLHTQPCSRGPAPLVIAVIVGHLLFWGALRVVWKGRARSQAAASAGLTDGS